MGYEYIIKIEELESTQFMQRTEDALKAIDLSFFYGAGGELRIKDPSVESSWTYDVSMKKEDGGRIHVVLVGWSFLIYKVFQEALSALSYEISDDGECINLQQMSRLK